MKLKQQNSFWLVPSAILSVLAITSIPVLAADNTIPIFDVQASLITPRRISLGEPILVHCDVKNISGQTVAAHFGRSGTDWYTLTLRDFAGRVILAPSVSHSQQNVVPYWMKNIFMRDGNDADEYIPVTKILSIQSPGKYTLTFHVNLQYSLITESQIGSPGALTKASCLTQTQDITFPILVTAPDAGQLHAVAEKLQKSATDPTNGLLGRASMDALFSMPEEQVSAIWRDLALKPSMNNDLVASELETLHSKTGIDILVEMLDVPDLQCTPVSDRINRVYNAADPDLREHIKDIARKHGFEMPDIAGVPAVLKDPDPDGGGVVF